MSSIDIFYQGEGILEFEHIEVSRDYTLMLVKKAIAEKHGIGEEFLIFVEDGDEPLAEETIVIDVSSGGSGKLHVHRCHHVEVSVSFGGETVHHKFSPAKTVGAVKNWAAIRKFGMTEAEAGEHLLQIAGTKVRPAPGTHIGTLAKHPACKVAFDLVPDERINGAPGTQV